MSFTGRGKLCVLTLKCAIEHSYVTSGADEEKDWVSHFPQRTEGLILCFSSAHCGLVDREGKARPLFNIVHAELLSFAEVLFQPSSTGEEAS